MNLKKAYPIIAAFIFLIASCDKIEEATTVAVDSTEKITFNVTLNPGQSISSATLFDLSNNADIKDYLDNLKGVEITEAYYTLIDFSGTSTTTTASLSIALGDEIIGPYEHNLVDDTSSPSQTTLDATKLNAAATKLYQDKKLNVAVQGKHNIPASEPNGETVTVELYLKLKFTASAL